MRRLILEFTANGNRALHRARQTATWLAEQGCPGMNDYTEELIERLDR